MVLFAQRLEKLSGKCSGQVIWLPLNHVSADPNPKAFRGMVLLDFLFGDAPTPLPFPLRNATELQSWDSDEKGIKVKVEPLGQVQYVTFDPRATNPGKFINFLKQPGRERERERERGERG